MGISKVNKKSSSNNPFKARCKRQVLFNTRGDDGGILSPKLAKEKLTLRRALLKYQFDSGNISADIQLQLKVVEEELFICNTFLQQECERAKKTKKRISFHAVENSLSSFDESHLLLLKAKIDSIINNTSTAVISHTTEALVQSQTTTTLTAADDDVHENAHNNKAISASSFIYFTSSHA